MILYIFVQLLFFGSPASLWAHELNRPHFKQKKEIPSIPVQTKDYINIANYNIRYAYPKYEKPGNTWHERKPFFFKTVGYEDEAHKLMLQMQQELQDAIRHYLPKSRLSEAYHDEPNCVTCACKNKEPYPIAETTFFRIALTVKCDDRQRCLYGNFPYPYRLIIALKRHVEFPSGEEMEDLERILNILETDVARSLGAQYTSYAKLGDQYYRKKNTGEKVSFGLHYRLHFVFRFPKSKKIDGVTFDDPNPYDQFQLFHSNLVKAGHIKSKTNIIYKKIPEVITFQEVTYAQAQDLKQEMPLHDFIGYTAYDGTSLNDVKPDDWIEELLVIGYKRKRFACLGSGVRWLSKTPHEPSHDEGVSRNRIVMWAKLKDKETEEMFFIFNAHYDHVGSTQIMIDAEVQTIKEIAREHTWFAVGERFYKDHRGLDLYQRFVSKSGSADVRDLSLMGHYGEAGSWGGFEDDPYRCEVKRGDFMCDTLDVFFTNAKKQQVLVSYSIHGAYDPQKKKMYALSEPVKEYRLASDHFMTGCYVLLDHMHS